MGRRVRLQVLDDSLPAGVEPCCGNCEHSAASKRYGFDVREKLFPLRCEVADMEPERPTEAETAEMLAGRMCVTIDGSDYFGELWVRPEFGCINWEPKQG